MAWLPKSQHILCHSRQGIQMLLSRGSMWCAYFWWSYEKEKTSSKVIYGFWWFGISVSIEQQFRPHQKVRDQGMPFFLPGIWGPSVFRPTTITEAIYSTMHLVQQGYQRSALADPTYGNGSQVKGIFMPCDANPNRRNTWPVRILQERVKCLKTVAVQPCEAILPSCRKAIGLWWPQKSGYRLLMIWNWQDLPCPTVKLWRQESQHEQSVADDS